MNAEPPTARFQMEHQPRRPGYARRSSASQMFDWLRKLLSKSTTPDSGGNASHPESPAQDYTPMPLSQLFVEPDDPADFDRESCEQLIRKMAESGAVTVDDVHNIPVGLEDFFDGNQCRYSIAANAEPAPPYDTASAWYEILKRIRDTDGVENVLVSISMIEPYQGGRVGMWPYSDTIWIYSSLDRDAIASLLTPICPDEVRDASLNDANWELKPPMSAADGVRPYWVWWD
jgi:hypothetical protein